MNQPSKDTLLKFDDIRNSILQEEEGRVINSNLIHGLNNVNDFTIHTELADFISPSDKNRSIEPHEYFAFLKSKFSHTELCYLFYSLEFLLGQIQNAKKINQRKLLEIIHFNSKNILREILLNIKGINQFVEKKDLLDFVKYVKPRDSIKFIELERYHRTIPQEIVERIAEVKSFNLFDKYFILYTDFTGQNNETTEEKEIISRNKDPIIFGYFEEEKLGWVGERFYPFADWEDEYCDLTLDKLTDKMAKSNIGKGVQTMEDLKSVFEHSVKNLIEQEQKQQPEFIFKDEEFEEKYHSLEKQVEALKLLLENDEEKTLNLNKEQVEVLLKNENQLKGYFKKDRENPPSKLEFSTDKINKQSSIFSFLQKFIYFFKNY